MRIGGTVLIAVVVSAVAAACFAAGLSIGSNIAAAGWSVVVESERGRASLLESELAQKESELNDALSRAERLEAQLQETRRLLSETEERLASLQASLPSELEELRRSNQEAARTSSELRARIQRVTDQVKVLSNAIPILNQLRGVNMLGPDRNATLSYWLDIKGLVSAFEPALTPTVDRVINNVDGLMDYYRWLERYPGDNASAEEIVAWIMGLPPSYQQYIDSVNQFVQELLTTVASKLSALRDSLS